MNSFWMFLVILSKPIERFWNNILTRPFDKYKTTFIIRLPWSSFYFRPLFFNEWYYVFHVGEPYMRRELKRLLKNTSIFIDVGAHIGYHTVYARNLIGESGLVIAVEPDDRNLIILERNCSRFNNVKILRAAAGNSDIDLFIHQQFNPLLNTVSGEGTAQENDIKKVPSIRLDDIKKYFVERNYANIVIKIDVEGLENEVIMGAMQLLKDFRPYLIIEVTDVKRVEVLLQPFGYQSIQLLDSYWLFAPGVESNR